MWAGEREQSDGYSVNVDLPCWYITSNKVRVVSFPYIDTSAVLESIFTCIKNMKISYNKDMAISYSIVEIV